MSDRYSVVIAPGLWRGFVVSVEPRTIDRPSREFKEAAEAEAFAEDLGRVEGWPLVDRRGGGDGGGR